MTRWMIKIDQKSKENIIKLDKKLYKHRSIQGGTKS